MFNFNSYRKCNFQLEKKVLDQKIPNRNTCSFFILTVYIFNTHTVCLKFR